jgi:hypothetical protein
VELRRTRPAEEDVTPGINKKRRLVAESRRVAGCF